VKSLRIARHAARNLVSRPFQSLLLVLSGAAGILSVVIVDGLSSGVEKQLQALITDWRGQHVISAFGRRVRMPDGRVCEQNSLTTDDMDALSRELKEYATLYPRISMPATVDAGGSHRRMDVTAVGNDYFRLSEWFTVAGEPLTADDEANSERVSVIGNTLAVGFFGDANAAVGNNLRINGFLFRIKGVLEPRGRNVIGEEVDEVIFVPFTTASRRVFCVQGLRAIGYEVHAIGQEDYFRNRIRTLLRQRHQLKPGEDDDFRVTDPKWLREMYAGAFASRRRLGLVLMFIASAMAIAVIANVMLLSVQQRRVEIGLKRAVGGTRRDIQVEIFCHTALLALAAAGIAISIYAATVTILPSIFDIAPGFSSFPLAFTWKTMVYASLLAIVIAVASGAAPARRAAKLDPAEALRQ
jgi:putative ABC transport system permease protein